MKKIIYYAPNRSLGDDMTEDQCDEYRSWAEGKIRQKFHGHEVTTTKDDSTSNPWTNDEENREEIQFFCSRLWDLASKA